MTRTTGLLLNGAAGILLAALVYFLAGSVAPVAASIPTLRSAELFVFLILLGVSVAEIPLIAFGLRALAAPPASLRGIPTVLFLYVAFGGVYAGAQVLLFGDSILARVILALVAARFTTGIWVLRGSRQMQGFE